MTEPIGTYTFLPWVRQGLANHIGPATATRPAIEVTLDIEGTGKGGTAVAPVDGEARPSSCTVQATSSGSTPHRSAGSSRRTG